MPSLKRFVNNFNFKKPDFSTLPKRFPNGPLTGLNSGEVGKFAAIKTYWEIERVKRKTTQSRSRVWTDPEGYKYLVAWSNAVLLRFLIRLLTDSLPKSEYRRKSQLDDCARSVVRNIEEGYKRSTTSDYLQFIGYSQGSLEETKGDVRELTEDGFLKSVPGSSLSSIGINLGDFHQTLRSDKIKGGYRKLKDDKETTQQSRKLKPNPNTITSSNSSLISSKISSKHALNDRFQYRHLTELYPPLRKIRPSDLSYEIFLELINKTDWNFRKLVVSLESKLEKDQKFYKVEQARIKGNLRLNR
jgi:four helix bundle protein